MRNAKANLHAALLLKVEKLEEGLEAHRNKLASLRNEFIELKTQQAITNDELETTKNMLNATKNEFIELKNQLAITNNEWETTNNEWETAKNEFIEWKNVSEDRKRQLVRQLADEAIADELADAFCYFREYVLKVEKNSSGDVYTEQFVKLNEASDIIIALDPPSATRADDADDLARKAYLQAIKPDAEKMMNRLGVDRETVLEMSATIEVSNGDTHKRFHSKDYGDKAKIKAELTSFIKSLEGVQADQTLFHKREKYVNFFNQLLTSLDSYY